MVPLIQFEHSYDHHKARTQSYCKYSKSIHNSFHSTSITLLNSSPNTMLYILRKRCPKITYSIISISSSAPPSALFVAGADSLLLLPFQ